jgi:PadR family transcriptional regulator, regulatory protein PadR
MRNTIDLPQGCLEMLILEPSSLWPLHGDGILLRIQQIFEERLEILQGFSFSAFYRLERRVWIRGEWRESENNRQAKFYPLTNSSNHQLKEGREKWADMAGVIANILQAKADRA